jgi:hypothetical protein
MSLAESAPNRVACTCCLEDDVAELRLDRRNRPFLRCTSCGSMTFMPSRRALRGLVFLQPHIRTLIARLTGDELLQQDRQAGSLLEKIAEDSRAA